jgi:hypothetical protein
LVAAALLLTACEESSRREDDRGAADAPSPSPRRPRPPAFEGLHGGWTKLPAPPEVRVSAAAVGTDEGLIVWGGYVYSGYSDEVAQGDGFRYDVRTQTWDELPDSPLQARTIPASVWTGTQLLIWGGARTPDLDGYRADGAAFDPASGTWRMLPPAPLSARAPLHVWTGRELIVWGTSVRVDDRPRDGAAYDPVANEWRTIAEGPVDLTDATASWTGREMIVFGAALHGGNKAETETAIGAAYDPTRDMWRLLPKSPLSPQASTAAWQGQELIAWDYLNGSAAYDPVGDRWRRLPRVPLDDAECGPESVSIGTWVFGDYCSSMVVFDRADEKWHDVSHRELAGFVTELVAAGPAVFVMGRDTGTLEELMFAYRPR